MGYLFDNCTISLFSEELLHACEPFSCGDEDLDDFFSSKALDVNPPKDEEQRLMRLANPTKLETRLMFTDLLKD